MKDNLNIKNKSTLVKDVETVSLVETTTQVSESGVSVLSESLPKVSKRGRGRPPKAEVEKKLKPGKRGRPVGDYTKARELCARMLVSEGDRMLKTLINMALTDGHPNQIPALKMCLDRALPISYFESKDGNGGSNGITINISGLTTQVQSSQSPSDNVIDVEVSDEGG
jgi:hypothetical protein